MSPPPLSLYILPCAPSSKPTTHSLASSCASSFFPQPLSFSDPSILNARHGRAVDDRAGLPFPEPRPQLGPADCAAGGDRHQGPRGGGLHVRQERPPRGRGARGGAPARGRGEQAAGRDAPRARRQVRRAAGQGHRHDGRQPAPPPVVHDLQGRLGGVAVQEARPQRQPRYRGRPPQPFAPARRGRERRRLRRHRRRQPRPRRVHVRPRAQQAHPRRRVQAKQGLQALRPRRPRRPQPRGEGRVPMAEVRSEGDQGQPVPEGLLPVLLRAVVHGEEEGAAQRRGHDRAGGNVRGRPQPRPAHRQARRRQEGRRVRRRRSGITTGGSRTASAAAAAATTTTTAEAGGGGGGGQEEPGGADGGDADEGPRVQGGARLRALRPDHGALAVPQLIGQALAFD